MMMMKMKKRKREQSFLPKFLSHSLISFLSFLSSSITDFDVFVHMKPLRRRKLVAIQQDERTMLEKRTKEGELHSSSFRSQTRWLYIVTIIPKKILVDSQPR